MIAELVSGSVEAVSEEKARKVLERVDFLSRLREDVSSLPDLRRRLERLAEPALDLPEWWIPGKHDADLVIGAARYVLYCTAVSCTVRYYDVFVP